MITDHPFVMRRCGGSGRDLGGGAVGYLNPAKGHVVEGSVVIVVVGEPLGVAAAGRVVWWWW
jgi:hypothetical protein